MAMKRFLNGILPPVKLLTALVLIIAISIAVTSTSIAGILLRSHESMLEKRSIGMLGDSLSVARSNVNNYLESTLSPLSLLSNDSIFIDLLNSDRNGTERDKLVKTFLLNEELLEKGMNSALYNPYMIAEDSSGEYINLSYPMNMSSPDLRRFLSEDVVHSRNKYYGIFLEPVELALLKGDADMHSLYIPFVQNLISFTPYSYEGRIIASIPEERIWNEIKINSIAEDGMIMVFNKQGSVISCSDRTNVSTRWNKEKTYFDSLDFSGPETHLIDRSNDTLCIVLHDATTEWTYAAITPLDSIYGPIHMELLKYVFIVIAIMGIAIYAVILMARHMTEPFDTLKDSMRNVMETRNFKQQLDERGPSDVRELTRAYNVLCNDMDAMIWKEYELRRQTQLAEFDALVTQINPHFLSNTLDSIVWKAYMADVPEIAEMASTLGELFSLALNGGNAMTSLGNEIRYARAYIELQNCRYDGKIDLDVLDDIGEDLDEIIIPKLIVQPIIENSLKHGFDQSRDSFNITITLECVDDMTIIRIADSGRGMDAETLERTRRKLLQRKDYDHKKAEKNFRHGEGVGMTNVNQRLKLYYGEEAGLFIESTGKEGTVIVLTMPFSTFDQDSSSLIQDANDGSC